MQMKNYLIYRLSKQKTNQLLVMKDWGTKGS